MGGTRVQPCHDRLTAVDSNVTFGKSGTRLLGDLWSADLSTPVLISSRRPVWADRTLSNCPSRFLIEGCKRRQRLGRSSCFGLSWRAELRSSFHSRFCIFL